MLKLTGNFLSGTPLCALQQGKTTRFNYSPWGTASEKDAELPGFNGQRHDPLTAVNHLGNGYRAYSPALMRFTCPDSLSPFGKGGINPYVYCGSDPINHTDPSGHFFLITFFASLFSSLAASAIQTVGAAITGAAAGLTAGAEAGAAAGAAVGTGAAMTTAEFAAATATASTSAAFAGVGTAVGAGAEVASAVAVAGSAAGLSGLQGAATLGVVNAAIGTAIQTSSVTVAEVAIGLGVEYGGIAASFYTKLGRKLAENAKTVTAEMSVSTHYALEQAMAAQNAYSPAVEPSLYLTDMNVSGSRLMLNTNRASRSVQTPDVRKSTGIQGTPARNTYLQSMGYHPSRLQTKTDAQGINQTASSESSAENDSQNGMIKAAGIFGMNNRDLHQKSYKSAHFKNAPQAQ